MAANNALRFARCRDPSLRLAAVSSARSNDGLARKILLVDEAAVPGSVEATVLSARSAISEGENPTTPRQITSTFQAKRSGQK